VALAKHKKRTIKIYQAHQKGHKNNFPCSFASACTMFHQQFFINIRNLQKEMHHYSRLLALSSAVMT
jgi:hypothetical protein